MLAAPLSEMHGRHYVSVISIPIAMLFTLGAGFSHTFAALLACRFFSGFFGSPVLAVGMGTQADLFPPDMIAPATAFFLMAPFLGPCLGPVIGGFAAEFKGWRWAQWCMLFLALVVFLIGLPTQETYKKAILKKRAKRLRLPPPPKLGSSRLNAVRVSLCHFEFRMYLLTPSVDHPHGNTHSPCAHARRRAPSWLHFPLHSLHLRRPLRILCLSAAHLYPSLRLHYLPKRSCVRCRRCGCLSLRRHERRLRPRHLHATSSAGDEGGTQAGAAGA